MQKFQCFLIFSTLFVLFFYVNSDGKILVVSFAQTNEEKMVTIPKGSANPEVDITKFTLKQWYKPAEIIINVNDTIKWINDDTEPHTVTSGLGGGLSSAATNSKGKPNGFFDSGLFKPNDSWSLKFNKSGTFNYFCTIHPWMEGIVNVKGESTNIPPYAVDKNGNRIDKVPSYVLSNNKKFETGLSWSPSSIKTNEPINFIIDFFEMPKNTKLHLWPYNFILIQNGKEIYRTTGITQIGSSAVKYAFSAPGNLTIKIENNQDPSSFSQYGTIVYDNPNPTSHNMSGPMQNSQAQSSPLGFINTLTLVYSVYAIIIGIPIVLVVFVILIKKRII
jgi:plastocyanin